MAMKMNDFLLEYYKRFIFRNMPVEQFAQFSSYLDKDDKRGNMKHWAKELLEPDPTDPNKYLKIAGVYVRKPLLEASDMGPNDWEKLYIAFQNAFSNMDANRKDFKYDDKALKFLDKYFGAGKLFNHEPAPFNVENALDNQLQDFLDKYHDQLDIQLAQWGALPENISVQDLIDGIKTKKYNSDLKFRNTISKVAQYIDYNKSDDDFINRLGPGAYIPDFSIIFTGFRDAKPTPGQLNALTLEFHRLLQELQTNSAAYKVFKQYDDNKISKHLDAAREFVNYDDPNSDSYVRPKREDKLTLPQQVSKWVSDQYEDYLAKYTKFTGDRLFFSSQAKDIISALTKAKVKPTDGLQGIVDKAGDVTKALKDADKPKSAKHMDWFIKQMNDFKSDKNMSHIFAGALKKGRQLNALVQELIMNAVKENKIDEAKTAMEVLSVAKFGYTTSAVMDAMGKTDFTIFSDKELSWNKNEGVKVITAAMDKTVKWAFMGIGYAITAGTNAIRLSGSKIDKTNKTLSAQRQQVQAENDIAKTKLQTNIANEHTQKANTITYIRGLTASGVTNTAMQSQIKNHQTNLDTLMSQIEAWATANQTHPNIADLYQYIKVIDSGGIPAVPPMIDPAIDSVITNAQMELQAKKTAQDKLLDLRNAARSLRTYNEQIKQHEAAMSTWDKDHTDKAEELANYWNMLETGRGTHTGTLYNWFGSKKKAQKNLDAGKKALIAQYMQSHQIGLSA